jgi:hypothetical protein
MPCGCYQQLIPTGQHEANTWCIRLTYSQLEEDDRRVETLIKFITRCGKLFDAEKRNENRLCYWKQRYNAAGTGSTS